jgi:hypothetical protein
MNEMRIDEKEMKNRIMQILK